MNWKAWTRAAAIRAIKTICQTAVASISTAAVLSEVDWKFVVSASLLAGILSVLTSLAGLPEVDQDPAFDDFLDDIDRIAEERTDEDRRDGSEADHAED